MQIFSATEPRNTVLLFTPASKRYKATHTRDLNWFLLVCWVLSATGMTLPGRSAPLSLSGLDTLAFVKLAARGMSFVILSLLILRHNDNPRLGMVMRRMFPLVLFAAWALVSICWSPAPAVTAGHSFDLVVLLFLSGVAGLLCLDTEDYKRVFFHITLLATVISLFLIVANFQMILQGRPRDFMHPNDMAKNAGAGLILFTFSYLLWRWPWTQRMLLPTGVITSFLVYGARSRTASILVPLVLMSVCFRLRRVKTVVALFALFGLFALIMPYSAVIEHVPDSIAAYMARGQSAQDLKEFSGRTEMWSIAWSSFLDSPLFGHGYYVMTSTGFFKVWLAMRFETAHNAFLHVITGLGVIGTSFLLWMLGLSVGPCLGSIRDTSRGIEFVALTMITWYCAMGMFELSFFGPVDTAVVLFFVLLGIGATRQRLPLRAGISWASRRIMN